MVIKKKKKETWIRGYKEEIQTMSPSRQIDTVNRTTTGSAATINLSLFRGGDEIASRHVLRVTPFYRRGFLCGEYEHTRKRGKKRKEKKKKRKKTSTEVEKDPQERYTRDAEDT